MTAPSPYLSPTAGLLNALVRHVNRLLRARIGELTTELADAVNRNHELGGDRQANSGGSS